MGNIMSRRSRKTKTTEVPMGNIMSTRSRKRKITDVPNELVFEIFSWLPVKSLLRFKSGCRDWLVLIEDPDFIAKHHERGSEEYFLIHRATPHLRINTLTLHYRKTMERVVASETDLAENQFIHQGDFYLFGPYNGIYCIFIFESDLLNLWNPATKELKALPKPLEIKLPDPVYGDMFDWFQLGGFGFDSKTNDYKGLRVYFLVDVTNSIQHPPDRSLFAQVYSLRRDSWREIDTTNVLLPTTFQILYDGFINEKYFWLINDYERIEILSFDFSTEIFTMTGLPDACNHDGCLLRKSDHIFVLDGCIAFLYPLSMDRRLLYPPEGGYEIWVLNEIGNKESLTKLYEFKSCTRLKAPLGSLKSDQLFSKSKSGELVWCAPIDPKIPQMRDGTITATYEYKESLVKLKT